MCGLEARSLGRRGTLRYAVRVEAVRIKTENRDEWKTYGRSKFR